MSRPGLDTDAVVDAAGSLVAADPDPTLTLSAVAAELGVRTPSLYNHVDGVEDLRRRLSLKALDLLRQRLLEAVAGRSGDAAVRAAARALRGFASEQPGLYAFTTGDWGDDEAIAATARSAAEPVLAALRARGLDDAEAVHAARTVRSAVHGFVSLEQRGGFQLPVPTDDSFEAMLDALCRGLPTG